MSNSTTSSENSLVKISDLLGLSEPLTKLIEYSCKGIGVLWKPVQIEREAKAEANAVRILSDAIVDPQHIPLEINYQGETLQLRFDGEQAPTLSVTARASQRLIASETRKQQNIEGIVQFAAEQLKDEETVPDHEVDEDWATRFFKYSEDVTSEQMRQLWGRVLAGKVKQPNSFGLRTLDFLRNVSVDEANMFDSITGYIVSSGPGPLEKKYILNSMVGNNHEPIVYGTVLALGEIGLVIDDSNLALTLQVGLGQQRQFFVGENVLLLEGLVDNFKSKINVRPLTSIGNELLSLSDGVGTNPQTLKALLKVSAKLNVKISVGDLGDSIGDGRFGINNLKEYTKEEIAQL